MTFLRYLGGGLVGLVYIEFRMEYQLLNSFLFGFGGGHPVVPPTTTVSVQVRVGSGLGKWGW